PRMSHRSPRGLCPGQRGQAGSSAGTSEIHERRLSRSPRAEDPNYDAPACIQREYLLSKGTRETGPSEGVVLKVLNRVIARDGRFTLQGTERERVLASSWLALCVES